MIQSLIFTKAIFLHSTLNASALTSVPEIAIRFVNFSPRFALEVLSARFHALFIGFLF